jgi:hypothetical protein
MIFTTQNDVSSKNESRICIHKYLKICRTNPQPPGMGDYIRGTITLFYFCKQYNYELFLDADHEIFHFLRSHPRFLRGHPLTNTTYECLPPIDYYRIYNDVERMFQSNESFCIMTNSFYKSPRGILENWPEITSECREFMSDIFRPNEEIVAHTNDIFHRIHLEKEKGYSVIHLRLGDAYLHNDHVDENKLNYLISKIRNVVSEKQYILLADSRLMSEEIVRQIEGLFYYPGSKIHLGDLRKGEQDKMIAVRDTMTDFFIMSECNEIYCLQPSGFSQVASLLFDKPYYVM